MARARPSDAPAAQRIAREAELLLAELGVDIQAPPEAAPAGAGRSPDAVAEVLRAQAAAAEGSERAALLERLAGHLERGGDAAGASDALLGAVEADPGRALTWSWLLSLIEHDAGRLDRARALRARAGLADLEAGAPSTGTAGPGTFAPEPGGSADELPVAFETDAGGPGGPARAEPILPAEPFATWPESPDLAAPHGAGHAELSFEPPAEVHEIQLADAAGTENLPSVDELPPLDLATAPAEPSLDHAPAEPPASLDLAAAPVQPLLDHAAPSAPPRPERTEAEESPAGEAGPERTAADAARAAVAAAMGANAAEQARLRRELARALEAEGDLDGATGALLGAHAADPGDAATAEWLARLQDAVGRHLDAIAAWEAVAELRLEGPARAARLAELAARAEALGANDRAHALYERARAGDPRLVQALLGLARLSAARGERPRVLDLAAEIEGVAGREALDPISAPLGRALLEAGDVEEASERLEIALRQTPDDLTVARDLSRCAEKLGRFEVYVRLGEVCADAIATYDPLAAAARYRHFSEVLRDRLGDAGRAAVMLEKALALVPEDPDTRRALCAMWASRPETAGRALDAWLEIARGSPADGAALGAVAALARAVAHDAPREAVPRIEERGRIAASLAFFVAPAGGARAPALRLAAGIPTELRVRVSVPGAGGPLARLLRLLSPWLEPLFPAELARRGASAADRLVPPRAPELRHALESAGRALGARPHAAFLADRPGVELALENTQPPAIVAGADVEALPPGALHFLAARTLDLLDRGWALAGKFAPRDVGILLELACRFGGGSPPSLGLPAQRADAFLTALDQGVPPAVREEARRLGLPATDELAGTDPRALAAALRRSANRVGLLYAGDPGAAIAVLARLDRRLEAAADPAEALAIPDLRDLALFALSEPFLDLREAVVG